MESNSQQKQTCQSEYDYFYAFEHVWESTTRI